MIFKEVIEVTNTSRAVACPICNASGVYNNTLCYTCGGMGMVQVVTAVCEMYQPFENVSNAPLYVDDLDLDVDIETCDLDDELDDLIYLGDLDVK